jgi:hypothetical protein
MPGMAVAETANAKIAPIAITTRAGPTRITVTPGSLSTAYVP